MSRRTDRVGNLIRNTLGELLFTKLADPRVDPGRVSITRVEVPEDFLTARVFVSVMGTQAEGRKALRGLQDSAGRLQEHLSRLIRMRNTPRLTFVLDEQFKRTLETLDLIERAMDEIRRKEQGDQDDLPEQAEADEADEADQPPGPTDGPGDQQAGGE